MPSKPRVKATKMWATAIDHKARPVYVEDLQRCHWHKGKWEIVGGQVSVHVIDSRDYRDLLRDAKAWRAMQNKKAKARKAT